MSDGVRERLVQARRGAGYATATAAADAMGIPPPTYLAHENGTKGIRQDTAKRYARFFRVDEAWLLLGKGPKDGKISVKPDAKPGDKPGGEGHNTQGDKTVFTEGAMAPEEVELINIFRSLRGESRVLLLTKAKAMAYDEISQHPFGERRA